MMESFNTTTIVGNAFLSKGFVCCILPQYDTLEPEQLRTFTVNMMRKLNPYREVEPV